MIRCGECNGYPIESSAGLRRTFKVCQCPASIRKRTDPTPESLEDQIRALAPHIPAADRIPFLAGMRFAQGFEEYGNGLFRISSERLAYEKACEQADVYVMNLEQSRRKASADE